MAAHDADTPSFQGANNIYLWILNNEQESSGKFIQPYVGELNW
ncbi:hypothetical protein [Bacillus sp. 491mf]|nr:hypothetical protein [Bacillus sp. 491mf]